MSSKKKWNWQQDNWPDFEYDSIKLQGLENHFLHHAGILLGASFHINEQDKINLIIELMCDEAIKTSEIEDEALNRASIQSSIQRKFGFKQPHIKAGPAEAGIAELMFDLYQNFKEPLTHEILFEWHSMIMNGRRDIDYIGEYRKSEEPMQVVSRRLDDPTIHFEAPPSDKVPKEMKNFIKWFNETSPKGKNPLPPLTRASITHLYFESIHPFEDGNGRIGRALSEKALAQYIDKPIIIGLSYIIQERKKTYYDLLEKSNKSNNIDNWLKYFCEIILESQELSKKQTEFIIQKTKFFDKYQGQLNERQQKTISRIFREGINGFKGGLSAEKYISITKTTRPTTTRDLNDLVKKNAFIKTGTGKGTRYFINLIATAVS